MKPLPGGALLDDYNWRPAVPASGLDEPGGETPANISGREYPGAGTKFALDWPGVGELDLSGYVPPEVRRFAVGANALLNPIQPSQTAAENAGWLSLGLLAAPFRSAVQKAAGPASVDAWRNITRGAAGGAGLAALAPAEAEASPKGWWSVLEEAIRGAPGKMPAEQWTKYLAPGRQVRKGPVTGSLKSDELEYAGLQEILDRYPGKSIEPGNLLKDLEGRRWPEFDVRGVGGEAPDMTRIRERYRELQDKHIDRGLSSAEMEELSGLESAIREPELGLPTQYESYLTPGPKTGYQENLTKWDASGVKSPFKVEPREDGRFVLHDAEGPLKTFPNQAEAEQALRTREGEHARLHGFVPSKAHFNSEPNLLSHSRASVRQTPDGRRVRLVEEIQSDWHQQARDEGGYRSNSLPDIEKKLKALGLNKRSELVTISDLEEKGLGLEEADALWKEIGQAHSSLARPPRAPFQQTYPELELKKQLAQAIEAGDEYLAWTPGEEQIRRYSSGLQKQVSGIEWTRNSDGKYDLYVKNDRGVTQAFDDKTQNLDDKALRNLVGKEMADKIMAGGPQGTLQGGDLKIGGAGMRHFYDTVVRQQAEKLAKQYGGELTEVRLPRTGGKYKTVDSETGNVLEWPNREDAEIFASRFPGIKIEDHTPSMPAIKITDEMRRRFREAGGFPVWSVPAGIMSWEELMEPAQGED